MLGARRVREPDPVAELLQRQQSLAHRGAQLFDAPVAIGVAREDRRMLALIVHRRSR